MAKVTLNSKAFEELLRSPEITAILQKEAEALAQRAGPDFITESTPRRGRARVAVRAASFEGRRAEAKHGALSKAVASG